LKRVCWNRSERSAIENEAERQPTTSIFRWVLGIIALNVVGYLWLALRVAVPQSVQPAIDIFFQAGAALLLAYFAFRALFLYRFQLTDLLTIVLVLSVGMQQTVRVFQEFSALGLVGLAPRSPEFGVAIFQACLLMATVLVAGAAFGLLYCQRATVTTAGARAVAIAAGMLVLPAAAGVVSFPILLLVDVLGEESTNGPLYGALWCASLIVSVINTKHFVRLLALRAEINAREPMQ